MNPETTLRPARDDDAAGLIELIAGCFAEYAGCVLDVEGEEPELLAVATAFGSRGGRFWVAESDGRIVGCVGVTPGSAPDRVELKKLYVERANRRRGLAGRLYALVAGETERCGATAIELWSDTRFETAHHFYEKLGFVRQQATRALNDLSRTVEYRFVNRLRPGP